MGRGIGGEEALRRVEEAVGARAQELRLNHGQVFFSCSTEDLRLIVTDLRDRPELGFEYFDFLSGIDWSEFPETPGGLEVVIHLYSPEHVAHVQLRVPVDAEDPRCPSITDLFGGAIWHERETWEMFGIVFEGHPGLAPLYLPEDFEGHPLLKSFKLPSRIVKDWPGAKDPEEAAAGGR